VHPRTSIPSLLTAVALALTACGQAAAPAASSGGPSPAAKPSAGTAPASAVPSAPLTKVTLSYSNLIIDDLPLWVTQEAGIFRSNGLDVDLQLVESSSGVAALTSGDVQFGSMGGSEIMTAVAGGAKFTVLATLTPVYPYVFEATRDVKTVDDLKGKKVGVSKIGSSSDIATRIGLRGVGLSETDVTIVQVGSAAARTAAMANGAIQGALVQPPDNYALEKQGFHPLFDMAALKLPAVNTCLAATQTYLSAHRDVAQKLVDSIVQGIAREQSDKAFSVDVMKKYFKSDDTEAMSAAYDFHSKEIVPPLPYPQAANFTASKDALAAVDPKLASFDVTKMLDASFVDSAAQRGLGSRS